MKHDGRGIIRMSDKTDHGGQVISSSSGTFIENIEATLQGDMTFCPRCKGNFLIMPDGVGAKHAGISYAYHDDLTACGAKLISSV